ncbi:unnamed protein product, partial [Rodentolepis nana]|uniref:MFS domain-containing protein n=1 Tax=Rodentolepis nana TaxID=102285 RepID=A0A0R3T2X3_RODNA
NIFSNLFKFKTSLRAILDFVHNKILPAKEGVDISVRDATFIGSMFPTYFFNKIFIQGCATSLMSLAQYLCSSTFGTMSDTMGRKSVLLILCFVHIASTLLLSQSGISFVFFLLARILLGVSRAHVGILSAMISDVSDRESRTAAMASLGIAYSLAFTVGPKASSWILNKLFFNEGSTGSVLGPHIGLFAASLVCIDLLLLYTFPETIKPKEDTEKKVIPLDVHLRFHFNKSVPKRSFYQSLKILNPIELFRFSGIEDARDRTKMKKMAQVFFLHMSLYSGLECSLLFLAQQRFNYTGEKQSHIFLFTGVTMVIVQREVFCVCILTLVDLLFQAMLLQVLAYLTFGFSITEWMFYTALLLYSITSSLFTPTFNSLASLSIGPQHQGQLMGTFRSINGLARCVGPSLVGTLMWGVGAATAFTLASGATILVALLFKNIPNLDEFKASGQAKVDPSTKKSS